MTEINSRQGVEKLNIRKSRILLKKDNDPVKGLPKYKDTTKERESKLHTY